MNERTSQARELSGADRTVRVLIVDDHEVFGTSLAYVLDAEHDLQTVGVASTVASAKTMVASRAPDVVLLDHRLPDGDGASAIDALRSLRPGLQVVVLTASTSDQVLVAAMESGAAGFISKTAGLTDVVAAVRAAADGGSVVSPSLLARLLPRLSRPTPSIGGDLTDREKEVLGLLAAGHSNAAIADALTLSVHTVRNHVANLSGKLGAHSKLEALSIAVREGLLPGRSDG
ncbi:MAG TPA: response regulator transcription factor [Nocardioidaceae bacterium]|nr:response regulator transcription factor [Nocardioidaceae bacterium]